MNRITFTVETASDGGLVVYSDNGGASDMNLVFAGNQKETTDYLAKRVGELKAEKPQKEYQIKETEYMWDEATRRHVTVPGEEVIRLRAGAIA